MISKECHVDYVECTSGQFSHNLVSCTRVLDFGSTNDPVHRDASVLDLCLLMRYSEFVVGFVKILTEVGKFGEI